jgi:hypothetical protein
MIKQPRAGEISANRFLFLICNKVEDLETQKFVCIEKSGNFTHFIHMRTTETEKMYFNGEELHKSMLRRTNAHCLVRTLRKLEP